MSLLLCGYADSTASDIPTLNLSLSVHTATNDAFWVPTWKATIAPGDNSKSFTFSKIMLAFEVDLQLILSTDLDVEERVAKELHESIFHHLKAHHTTAKCLVLNLKSMYCFPRSCNDTEPHYL